MKTPQRFSFCVLTAEKKCRRFFGRLAIFFLVHGNTLRKTVSVKIHFLSFWDFECKFSVFCKNKLSKVARFHFTCPEKNFSRKKMHRKAVNFSFLVPTAKKIFRKKFGRLVKSVLVLSTVLFRGKLVFWRFVFFLSGSLSVNFMSFCKTKCALMSKNHFLSPQDKFGKKYFSLKFKVFLPFLYFERNVRSFSVGKSWNACQNGLYVSRISLFSVKKGRIHKILSFSFLERKIVCKRNSANLSKLYI